MPDKNTAIELAEHAAQLASEIAYQARRQSEITAENVTDLDTYNSLVGVLAEYES